MATYGLGNYKYDFSADAGTAKFHWYDPEDATNTADCSVSAKDFPEETSDPESRQVADIAYGLVAKQLNDKRDARIKREAAEQLEKQVSDDAAAREAAKDFFDNSKDQSATSVPGVQTSDTSAETKKKS